MRLSAFCCYAILKILRRDSLPAREKAQTNDRCSKSEQRHRRRLRNNGEIRGCRSREDVRSKLAKRSCQLYILQHPLISCARGRSLLWVWNRRGHVQSERYISDDALNGIGHRVIKAYCVFVPYYQRRILRTGQTGAAEREIPEWGKQRK
jgi:hypothetical protein